MLDNEAKNYLQWYELTKANEQYYIVFEYKKVVYLYKTKQLNRAMIKTRLSSNYQKTLSIYMNNTIKENILNNEQQNVEILMTQKEFNKKCKYYKTIKNYNKGNVTELLIYKLNNQKYERDNIAYYEDGDITINGVKIQVKYQNATIASYDTIANAINKKLGLCI